MQIFTEIFAAVRLRWWSERTDGTWSVVISAQKTEKAAFLLENSVLISCNWCQQQKWSATNWIRLGIFSALNFCLGTREKYEHIFCQTLERNCYFIKLGQLKITKLTLFGVDVFVNIFLINFLSLTWICFGFSVKIKENC